MDPSTVSTAPNATSTTDVGLARGTATMDSPVRNDAANGTFSAVAVTGTSGFLGPHVAAAFERSGRTVVRIDKTVPRTALGSAAVQLDLAEPGAIAREGVFDGTDVVCHLGGIGDAALAATDPARAFRDNVLATLEVVRAAHKSGAQRVALASTWHLYGRPDSHPVTEEHACRPMGTYALSKFTAERLALEVGAELGIDIVALRLGTAYGPGMRPRAVVRAMVEAASGGKELLVTDRSETFRQLVHVDDICAAVLLASSGRLPAGVYNVVPEEKVYMLELGERIAARYRVPIRRLPMREETDSFEVSSAKIESFGWAPGRDFASGLDEAIHLYGAGSGSAG